MNMMGYGIPSSQAVSLAASAEPDFTTLFGTGAAMNGIIHAAEQQVVSASSQARAHSADGASLSGPPA